MFLEQLLFSRDDLAVYQSLQQFLVGTVHDEPFGISAQRSSFSPLPPYSGERGWG
jgi:hypothetical protein